MTCPGVKARKEGDDSYHCALDSVHMLVAYSPAFKLP